MTHYKLQLAYLIGLCYSFYYFKRKGHFQKLYYIYYIVIIITILFAIFEELDIFLVLFLVNSHGTHS